MFSDVPADGYCVALGQMEPEKKRGTILATGQRLRFTFSMIAGTYDIRLQVTISYKASYVGGGYGGYISIYSVLVVPCFMRSGVLDLQLALVSFYHTP